MCTYHILCLIINDSSLSIIKDILSSQERHQNMKWFAGTKKWAYLHSVPWWWVSPRDRGPGLDDSQLPLPAASHCDRPTTWYHGMSTYHDHGISDDSSCREVWLWHRSMPCCLVTVWYHMSWLWYHLWFHTNLRCEFMIMMSPCMISLAYVYDVICQFYDVI